MEDNVEQTAKDMGHVPLADFKGDPEKWIDAQTFVDRGRNILPIVRKNNERLMGEVATVKGELSRTQKLLSDAMESMEEFKKYAEDDKKKAVDRAITKLKADKVKALDDGDHAAVVEIDEALGQIKDEQNTPPKKKEEPRQEQDYTQAAWFREWHGENSAWYGKDREKTAFADAQATFVRTMYPDLREKKFLDKITELVNDRYQETTPRKADKVEGSRNGSSGSSSGTSYDDLPADAKAACKKYSDKVVGEGKMYKTLNAWQQKYAADYFSE